MATMDIDATTADEAPPTARSIDRRQLLQLTGAGVAGLTGAGLLGGLAAAPPGRPSPTGHGPLTVHIPDVRSDELHLFVGEHEITVHDADLVRRLSRAAR